MAKLGTIKQFKGFISNVETIPINKIKSKYKKKYPNYDDYSVRDIGVGVRKRNGKVISGANYKVTLIRWSK